MLILNHNKIAPLNLVRISKKEQIAKTLPLDFLILDAKDFDATLELAKYCNNENVKYACRVVSIKEALLLIQLNVGFLLCKDLDFAKKLQNIAEIYLFDTKILVCIGAESMIEEVAMQGIDGVIFV